MLHKVARGGRADLNELGRCLWCAVPNHLLRLLRYWFRKLLSLSGMVALGGMVGLIRIQLLTRERLSSFGLKDYGDRIQALSRILVLEQRCAYRWQVRSLFATTPSRGWLPTQLGVWTTTRLGYF